MSRVRYSCGHPQGKKPGRVPHRLAVMRKEFSGRVVVLGVGNELLKDEGVGVHVARELSGLSFAFPVEIIEAGTVPVFWLGEEAISKLVVIDAVYGGCEPGAI